MASKLIQINKDGCPLSSCKIGTFSLEVGEEVKITLNGKNPDWPAFIVGEVVAVDPYTKGSGWSYTVDIEEDDLNGGPMFEDCDIEVACYSCCDALDERVTALENVVPDPDTNTTYTYSGNGIFVPSDGGPNIDASDLLDDTVIDTSATYEVINGVLTIPTVDAAGNPTGNSLTVNIPDKFGTNTDNGNGTNSNTDGNGVTVCNVACPPAGTPAGAVPSTDGSGAVTWAVPVPAQLDISFERVGDDLVLEVDSNNDQLEINGAFNFISTIAGVFTDNDTQDISAFSGVVAGGVVTLTHTAGGVTTPVQFPLGVSSVTTVSNPDGSTTITYVDGSGVTQTAGVIPADQNDISSFTPPVTNPDGSVTHTHVAGGVSYSWTTQPPSTAGLSSVTNFNVNATAQVHDDGTGNIVPIGLFDPSNTNLTSPTNAGAIEELATKERTWEDGAGSHFTNDFGHNEADIAVRSGDVRIGDTLAPTGGYKFQVIGNEEVFGQLHVTGNDRSDGDPFRFGASLLELRRNAQAQQSIVSESGTALLVFYAGTHSATNRVFNLANTAQAGVPQMTLEPKSDTGSSAFGDVEFFGWALDRRANFALGTRWNVNTNGKNMLLMADVNGSSPEEHDNGALVGDHSRRASILQGNLAGFINNNTDTGTSESSGSCEIWGFANSGNPNTWTQITFWANEWGNMLASFDIATGKNYVSALAPNEFWQPLAHYQHVSTAIGRIQITSTDYAEYDLTVEDDSFEVFRGDVDTGGRVSLGTGSYYLILSYKEQYQGAFGGF